jgi:hypothetical protein
MHEHLHEMDLREEEINKLQFLLQGTASGIVMGLVFSSSRLLNSGTK